MLGRLKPVWILSAAWLLLLVYAWPGYMNWDADEQLFQMRQHHVLDWHPPVMAAYWRLIEVFVHGPLGMLVLQATLFLWGMYRILCRRFEPRLAAWLAAALLVFPPILTPMAVTWKDAQMAGFLAAGLALALEPRRWQRALGVALLVLAAAVRDNGAFALPPLCLLIVGSWGPRRRIAVIALAAAMTIGIVGVAAFANKRLTDERVYPWYKTVAIHDLAGAICHDDSMSDADIDALLEPTGIVKHPVTRAQVCAVYTPRVWFELSFGGERSVFEVFPTKEQRLARRAVWWELVRDHTGAFLAHRWDVFAQVLGLTSDDIWEPVCQTFAANDDHLRRIHHDATLSWVQRKLGALFRWLAKSILFRPWAYAVLALVFLGFALARREALLAALAGSGLLYEASYFVAGAAPDFRYSHWMVTCTCLCAVVIFVERLRAGRARGSVADAPGRVASGPPAPGE